MKEIFKIADSGVHVETSSIVGEAEGEDEEALPPWSPGSCGRRDGSSLGL